MNKESIIFDFETLSLDRIKGVILSLAVLKFNEDRFVSNPYSWDELIDSAHYIKFSVKDQVKNYNRVIDPSTLEWWANLPEDAQGCFHPSPDDQPLDAIYPFLKDLWPKNVQFVYTRGNTFDPILLDYILKDINKGDIYAYWMLRDTRSMIDGLLYGSNLKNTFVPSEFEKKFIAHNPIHDIAMDVIRMQTIIQAI